MVAAQHSTRVLHSCTAHLQDPHGWQTYPRERLGPTLPEVMRGSCYSAPLHFPLLFWQPVLMSAWVACSSEAWTARPDTGCQALLQQQLHRPDLQPDCGG